jgi:hypothetical protein
MKKGFFLVCFCSLSCFLFAKQGIIFLKNGNKIRGNISCDENGNYSVERKKCSVNFSKTEVKDVKYTSNKETKDVSSKEFIQKMKNTRKIVGKTERENNYKYDPIIHTYANKYGLDPAFVKAVMETESNFKHNDVSYKGAIGLMQLMPGTAEGMKVNPKNIEENIEGGVKYLNYMYGKFGDSRLALAGYNAGPNAVKKYGKRIPPYRETLDYIEKVLQNYQKHKADKQMWYFVDNEGCVHISDSPKDKRYKRIVRD